MIPTSVNGLLNEEKIDLEGPSQSLQDEKISKGQSDQSVVSVILFPMFCSH